MTSFTIAGHTFADNPKGRLCTRCSRAWVDIAWVGPDQVGRANIACHGLLTAAEAAEIEAHRDRAWEAGRGA